MTMKSTKKSIRIMIIALIAILAFGTVFAFADEEEVATIEPEVPEVEEGILGPATYAAPDMDEEEFVVLDEGEELFEEPAEVEEVEEEVIEEEIAEEVIVEIEAEEVEEEEFATIEPEFEEEEGVLGHAVYSTPDMAEDEYMVLDEGVVFGVIEPEEVEVETAIGEAAYEEPVVEEVKAETVRVAVAPVYYEETEAEYEYVEEVKTVETINTYFEIPALFI